MHPLLVCHFSADEMMEQNNKITEPDNTAVRTSLWRALHVQVDAKPHIIEDEIGLKLIDPPPDWQERPDMKFTKRLRASIVARARFVDDLIIEQSNHGITQYVILGAGLDTFAQRKPDIASKLRIYEIDQPATLNWKQQRLIELGFGVPEYLHFVPVNFETSSWWEELLKAGFDINKPAVVSCTGVTLYLTKEAITSTNTEFLYLYGRALLLSGHSVEASKAFQRAIQLKVTPDAASIRKEATIGLAAATIESPTEKQLAVDKLHEIQTPAEAPPK